MLRSKVTRAPRTKHSELSVVEPHWSTVAHQSRVYIWRVTCPTGFDLQALIIAAARSLNVVS
ncbi:hypothetical protein IscW_ISCW008183 [Ixodes scapularis]|uniref:Uncharacterized protein n=1 Tax=Ixodes scapularis TaxID=6945 RepID=B7PS92_IXOSC|nr:hypothetical protein IscW_ISCW008183 [Ixodes scapularis]|eukprot:XP_002402079.1 hypothetical protein IscW_ISCW008183 [Ixodes scapularis]